MTQSAVFHLVWTLTLILFGAGLNADLPYAHAHAQGVQQTQESLPAEDQKLLSQILGDEPDLAFCAEWNPEFGRLEGSCCGIKPVRGGRKVRKKNACTPGRFRGGDYCEEMTQEQRDYIHDSQIGILPDVLDLIANQLDMSSETKQAYCGINDGFLVYGRPLIPSPKNRIKLRNPSRCSQFGTDGMIGMLEWVGRKIATTYPENEFEGTGLVVGDLSAPRGGCMVGRGGRRGHVSHTNGLDVDLAFLSVVKDARRAPAGFHQQFDREANWWLLKEIFQNPFACIKTVFLDKRLISKLAKVAAKDPYWAEVKSLIRHVRGHRNHFHIRVGEGPGKPGCKPNITDPDLFEFDPEIEEHEEVDSPQDTGDSGPSLESQD